MANTGSGSFIPVSQTVGAWRRWVAGLGANRFMSCGDASAFNRIARTEALRDERLTPAATTLRTGCASVQLDTGRHG